MKKSVLIIMLMSLVIASSNLLAQNFALQFDGTNDKIGVLDSPELNPTEAISVEAWINADVWAGSIWGATILSKQGGSPDRGYGLTVGENGRIEFNHSIDGAWSTVSTPQILGLNTWYHLAATFDGSVMKLYVNGILQATSNHTGTMSTADGVVMNIADNPTWQGRFFTGRMDEIRVWNVARTEAEIQANMAVELEGTETGLVAYWNMNEGTGNTIADGSGNENNGTLLNMDETSWVEGFTPPGADVGILGISNPTMIGETFSSEEYIKLDVKNSSTEEVTGFTMSYQINGGEEVSVLVNEVLPPFSSAVLTFPEPENLAGLTEVEITGKVTLEGDTNPENDEITETITKTLSFMLFDAVQHNFGSSGQNQFNSVYLPEDLSGYEQILIHVDLNCPTGGCDPWDQAGMLYVIEDGVELEILRYITPFGVACGGWTYDVTDFKQMLEGKTIFESLIQVWGASGWLLDMEMEFFPGTPEYPYVKIDPVWNTDYQVYGDPDISYDLPEITLPIKAETESAKIRMTVSGHGQGNTMNAAEFAEFTHHIAVDGEQTFDMHLWKDDCDENSCSPQSGTYLYSRAGWCPGQDIQPWEFNLEGHYTPGADLNLDFVLAEYTNLLNSGYNGSSHTEPFFRIHAYLVQYSSEGFVGIDDNTISDDQGYFEVYPNPSNGTFTVSGIDSEIYSVKVYRIDGSLIYQNKNLNTNKCQVQMPDATNGVYLLEVQGSEGVSVFKIAKN